MSYFPLEIAHAAHFASAGAAVSSDEHVDADGSGQPSDPPALESLR